MEDLAISITLEAAELLEHFQWKSPGEVEAFLAIEENRRRLGGEMADVLMRPHGIDGDCIAPGPRNHCSREAPRNCTEASRRQGQEVSKEI